MTTEQILAANTTKTRKMQQLLQLGFTRRQVADMMGCGYGFVQNVYAKMQAAGLPVNSSNIFAPGAITRTFGIEIEGYGVTMQRLATELRAQGLEVAVEGYNHNTRNHWKLVTDGSLSGQNTFELVSPVLEGEAGLEDVEKACRALKNCSAKINKSCGLHVHFGARDLSLQHWKNLYKNYITFEPVIDSLMPVSRRANNNTYCKSLTFHTGTKAATFAKIDAATNLEKIAQAVSGRSRYVKVNAESFFRHGTVEFRQHSGTVEFGKISNWVRLLNNLLAYSERNTAENGNFEALSAINQSEVAAFYQERLTELAA